MHLDILAFASASEALGTDRVRWTTEATTIGELKEELAHRHPELGPLWQRLAVSIDGEIATDAEPLHEGAEVALLPPVSGG